MSMYSHSEAPNMTSYDTPLDYSLLCALAGLLLYLLCERAFVMSYDTKTLYLFQAVDDTTELISVSMVGTGGMSHLQCDREAYDTTVSAMLVFPLT